MIVYIRLIPSCTGSRGSDNDEILLYVASNPKSVAENLVEASQDEQRKGFVKVKQEMDERGVPVFERKRNFKLKYIKNHDDAFDTNHVDYYWEKCYPHLFPYGRGGPSDSRYCHDKLNLSSFVQRMLQRGGFTLGMKQGRRFQMDPSFIFAAYVNDARRRVASVSVVAADIAANTSMHANTADPGTVTVGDIQSVIEDASRQIKAMNPTFDIPYDDPVTEASRIRLRTKMLIEKLIPYSDYLKGSPIYFALERKKLLSMLTSPAITSEGSWSWFATFAAPEVYESTLYETAMDAYLTNDPDVFEAMKALVREQTKDERLKILRDSPALSARLFHYKQEAIWEKLLRGQHKPLGDIGDIWRRVEV